MVTTLAHLGAIWMELLEHDGDGDALRDAIIERLRAGEMTPDEQRWLADHFDPNGHTRLFLSFSAKQGQHIRNQRSVGVDDRLTQFQSILDEERKKLASVIQRGGRDGDGAIKKAETEAVKRATVEITVKYKGRIDGISQTAAYGLLKRLKRNEDLRNCAEPDEGAED